MAMNLVKIGENDYINTNQIARIKYFKSNSTYEITLTNKEVKKVDICEHATIFDVTEEKEN